MDSTQDQKDQPTAVTNNQDAVLPVPPPVGGLAKEVEPFSQDLINASEKGPEISAELAEIGVEEVSQTPQLTQEHTDIGIIVSDRPIEPAAIPAPSSFQSPLTQAEMVAAQKSRISDAIAWLADTILRQIKRLKFNQKQASSKSI